MRRRAGLEPVERLPRLVADVERLRGPCHVARRHVVEVEPAGGRQAARQAHRELRVVGDLPGDQVERPTADDVGRRPGRERRVCRLRDPLELERRAQRIPDRQPQQRPACMLVHKVYIEHYQDGVQHELRARPGCTTWSMLPGCS